MPTIHQTSIAIDQFLQQYSYKNLVRIQNGYTYSIIKQFQNQLQKDLQNQFSYVTWDSQEHNMFKKGTQGDRIDIYGKYNGNGQGDSDDSEFLVIIEIDNTRADQVGKKMASRIAFSGGRPCIYIALCYPGNKSNEKECRKYFEYGSILLQHLNNKSEFLGYIIDSSMIVQRCKTAASFHQNFNY